MPDVVWEQVKDFFDPEYNGRLPDVHVPDTTVADWQALWDLVRSTGWRHEYAVNGRVTRAPHRAEAMLALIGESDVTLKVWPTADILAIFYLRETDQIDFDVDLRELQGQQRLDALCRFLRAIGRRLDKPVIMTAEGCDQAPILGYDVSTGRVRILAEDRRPSPDAA